MKTKVVNELIDGIIDAGYPAPIISYEFDEEYSIRTEVKPQVFGAIAQKTFANATVLMEELTVTEIPEDGTWLYI
jgi:hypothetical protein